MAAAATTTIDGPTSGPISYLTHFNGSYPWRVTIHENKRVTVHRNQPEEPVFDAKFNVQQVFVGKSPVCRMTTFSGGHGPRFDGNSILLRLSGDELVYLFVEKEIKRFCSEAPIVDFVSPVGNNDVPYPYAIDTEGRTYLLNEGVILEGKAKAWRSSYEDPYDYYYHHGKISANFGGVPPFYEWPDIRHWWVGSREFELNFNPIPEEKYDLDTTIIDGAIAKMYIEEGDGTKKELSKQLYVELMTGVGKARGFKPLQLEPINL